MSIMQKRSDNTNSLAPIRSPDAPAAANLPATQNSLNLNNSLSNICSIKSCNKVAFYKVNKFLFCENHKEVASRKQREDVNDYDSSSAAKYRNDNRMRELSKIK